MKIHVEYDTDTKEFQLSRHIYPDLIEMGSILLISGLISHGERHGFEAANEAGGEVCALIGQGLDNYLRQNT